jgi:hypothetical protein
LRLEQLKVSLGYVVKSCLKKERKGGGWEGEEKE